MRYILRWIKVMYVRNIYRKSREFRIEKECLALERKWIREGVL